MSFDCDEGGLKNSLCWTQFGQWCGRALKCDTRSEVCNSCEVGVGPIGQLCAVFGSKPLNSVWRSMEMVTAVWGTNRE